MSSSNNLYYVLKSGCQPRGEGHFLSKSDKSWPNFDWLHLWTIPKSLTTYLVFKGSIAFCKCSISSAPRILLLKMSTSKYPPSLHASKQVHVSLCHFLFFEIKGMMSASFDFPELIKITTNRGIPYSVPISKLTVKCSWSFAHSHIFFIRHYLVGSWIW